MTNDDIAKQNSLEDQLGTRASDGLEAIKQMDVPDTWSALSARTSRSSTVRRVLALAAAVALLGGAVAALSLKDDRSSTASADGEEVDSSGGAVELEPSSVVLVAQRLPPEGASDLAGAAITAFGLDLFAQLRLEDPNANLTVSPTSVAVALAMLEPGAVGAAADQLQALLRIADAAAFHASMNALEQNLENRVPLGIQEDTNPGDITIGIANAAYLQRGFPFRPQYLEEIGSNYGPVLREVDFEPDPDAVAHEINKFVADATNNQIVDLIDDGAIDPATVLALVNALYLKASWLEPFDSATTRDAPFTLLDGTQVRVPLMHGRSDSAARGDGWVGATKTYVGGLTAQFLLPNIGRFEEVADSLSEVFDEYSENQTAGAALFVPKFETRKSTVLDGALKDLGLSDLYQPGNLVDIAPVDQLVLDQVMHQTYVAMDEQGIEAAASTVAVFKLVSGTTAPPILVRLDRPFFYRIIDETSGATLFIGQITDPTA